jgi:phage gp29-like protein
MTVYLTFILHQDKVLINMPEQKFIYDAFGNKVYLKRPETEEIAQVRLQDVFSTYPSTSITAASLTSILKLADQGDVYKQMELFEEIEEKDTRIFSTLQTRKQAVVGLTWDIMPSDENDQEAIKRADFSGSVFSQIEGLDQALFDLLDAIGKGYAVSEIIWDIRDGRNIISSLKWRHQKRFTWDKTLTEAEPSEGESLVDYPAKFVIHQRQARSGYPPRTGLLRTLCWFYWFKSIIIKDWMRFCEVYAMPPRLGKYDPSATDADRTALKTAVWSLGSDCAGIISKSTEIEFIETIKGSSNSDIYKTLLEMINREITIVTLGQTATTEGTPGKLGSEEARENVRQDLLEADCLSLMETITRQMIMPLEIFNFGPQSAYSRFKLAYEPPEDLKGKAETVKILAAEVGLPVPHSYLYDTFKIPHPEGDEPVTSASRGVSMLPMKAEPLVMKDRPPFSPRQQGVEDIGNTALKEYEGIYPNIEKKLIRIVMNSDSLEQIMDRIYLAFDEISSDDLERLIARAMLLAQMYGRSTVSKK